MKTIKKISIMAISVLLALHLAACELPMMGFDDYDVSRYIQAYLDSSYLNSHDKFIAITQEEMDSAQQNNITTVENAAINFCNTYGISPDEEQMAALHEVMGKALLQAKYTVKEEQKVSTGYYIEVEVTPIISFMGLGDQISQLRTQAQEEAAEANAPTPSAAPPVGDDGDDDDDWDEWGDEAEPTPTPSPTPSPAPQVDAGKLFVDKVVEFCQGQANSLAFDSQPVVIALDILQSDQGDLQLDLNQIDQIDKTVLRFE